MPSLSKKEHVILLHGLKANRSKMSEMADFLERQDFNVHNISYPSTKYPVPQLINIIESELKALHLDDVSKVNWVGHSMGAILAQLLIKQHRPANLGRVVALAPPYAGSEVADLLIKLPPFRWLLGPALAELTTQSSPGEQLDHSIDYDLGVLAGNRVFFADLLFDWCLLKETNDGKVRVESTKIAGMRDHVILPVNHFHFPQYVSVMEQTAYFLRHGVFMKYKT